MKLSYILTIKVTGLIFLIVFAACSIILNPNQAPIKLTLCYSLLAVSCILIYNTFERALDTAYQKGKRDSLRVVENKFKDDRSS